MEVSSHASGRRTLPVWRHPEGKQSPGMLRYLLAIEPQRILSCPGVDKPEPGQEELFNVTMRLREVSGGMRLTVAAARFRFRPERWQEYENNPPTPKETPSDTSSDGSVFADESGSVSTDTGGSQFSLRGVKVITAGVRDDAKNQTRLGMGEVVPVGPHLQRRLPNPVFNNLPSSPTAKGAEGVVPRWAPSSGDLETGSNWGICVQFEPAACAGGSVQLGPEGRNALCSDSFIFRGAPMAGASIPPRVAMMRPVVEGLWRHWKLMRAAIMCCARQSQQHPLLPVTLSL